SNWMLDYKSDVAEAYDVGVNFTYEYNSDETRSDHASFWNEGYNATLAIETVFSPHYHSENDTLEHITIPQVEFTAQHAIGTVAHLAGLTGETGQPLEPTDPEPEEGAIDVGVNPELSVHVEHEEGDAMDVSFYDVSDDSLIDTDSNVGSGDRASVTWDGLDYSTTYDWYAVAEDSNGTSAQSSTWSFTTMEEPDLLPPKGIRVEKDEAAGDLIVKWDDVGAEQYNVYYSEDRYADFGTWQELETVSDTQYTHAGAHGGENYYIVRATDGTQESENSSMAFCVEKYFEAERPRHYISIPMGFEDRTGDGELGASDIVKSIEGDLETSESISDVVRWDPQVTGYGDRYYHDGLSGDWTDDFSIEPGDGIGLSVKNSFTWHINATDTEHEISFEN
ncbi:MAG: M28 family peptidase, partial [Candidatus Natronoplasma sp.]